MHDVILTWQPHKRFVEVAQVGAVVLFPCSDAASSITGIAFPVEGGWPPR